MLMTLFIIKSQYTYSIYKFLLIKKCIKIHISAFAHYLTLIQVEFPKLCNEKIMRGHR
jgi:hypothetical protein